MRFGDRIYLDFPQEYLFCFRYNYNKRVNYMTEKKNVVWKGYYANDELLVKESIVKIN